MTTDRPLLSLAMMVKDEERFLEDALLSARDWVDEMIVVDTGSTDRTVEIARDCGADVSFFPWTNDFSEARNETIKRSRGEWVAILDADERFRGAFPHRVRDLLKPSERWPYQGILLNIVNQNLDGQVTHSFFNPRLFPRHPNVGYSGRVHNCFGSLNRGGEKSGRDGEEELAKDFDLVKCNGLEIVHLGYDQAIYAERKKVERNLTLLEAAVREEPEVSRYRFYLGREYLNLGRYDEANVMLESVIKDPHADRLSYREARVCYLQSLHTSGVPFEVRLSELVATLEELPDEIDAWYFLALTYQEAGLKDEAISALKRGLELIDQVSSQLGQSCRLAGERARSEMIIGRYYSDLTPADEVEARRWMHEAWSHLSGDHPEWSSLIIELVKWALEANELTLLRDLLLAIAEQLSGVKLTRVFTFSLRELARRESPKIAKKIARRAISAQPHLRGDAQFMSFVSGLR